MIIYLLDPVSGTVFFCIFVITHHIKAMQVQAQSSCAQFTLWLPKKHLHTIWNYLNIYGCWFSFFFFFLSKRCFMWKKLSPNSLWHWMKDSVVLSGRHAWGKDTPAGIFQCRFSDNICFSYVLFVSIKTESNQLTKYCRMPQRFHLMLVYSNADKDPGRFLSSQKKWYNKCMSSSIKERVFIHDNCTHSSTGPMPLDAFGVLDVVNPCPDHPSGLHQTHACIRSGMSLDI